MVIHLLVIASCAAGVWGDQIATKSSSTQPEEPDRLVCTVFGEPIRESELKRGDGPAKPETQAAALSLEIRNKVAKHFEVQHGLSVTPEENLRWIRKWILSVGIDEKKVADAVPLERLQLELVLEYLSMPSESRPSPEQWLNKRMSQDEKVARMFEPVPAAERNGAFLAAIEGLKTAKRAKDALQQLNTEPALLYNHGVMGKRFLIWEKIISKQKPDALKTTSSQIEHELANKFVQGLAIPNEKKREVAEFNARLRLIRENTDAIIKQALADGNIKILDSKLARAYEARLNGKK